MRREELEERVRNISHWRIRGASYGPNGELRVLSIGYGPYKRKLVVRQVSDEVAQMVTDGRATVEVKA